MGSFFQTVREWRQARALARQGQRLYRAEDYAGAVVSYEAALRLCPGQSLVRLNLGLALYKGGRKREARDAWQLVVAETENSNAYLAEQARILLRQFG